MDNKTDGTIAGTEGEAAPAEQSSTVETPSEATTEQQQAEAGEQAPADDAGAEAKPKQVPWFQKRIDEVTRQKYEAERRAAYLEGQLQARQVEQPTKAETLARPTREQYNWDDDAYDRAVDEYHAKQAEKVAERVIDTRTADQKRQAQFETSVARLNQGAVKHEDFGQVVSDIPTTEAVLDFLAGNENAAEVLYELGRNPEAKAQFSSLSPYAQAVELGRLSARLEAPKPVSTRTPPPAPPQTVSGLSAGLSKRPEDMSMAEYMAWHKERDKT